MLHFNKLRLSGFKSFVDPVDINIDLGLTGIVGPNGCGKSNLVEALKWVMGETSAKQMRGGEMDDVIFAGTSERPARNVAEVVITLDNAERAALAQFNDAETLDVSRRIEREKGSNYRVNGKDVRARDVQLLFADQATGARSTALVSQGRIGAIISAKPTERRLLLEEAAGITGLHSRRHEAELRLRAADGNLERLEDILLTLEAQMLGLKKQARQATRYRNLSDHIRRAEATLFHIRWIGAESDMEKSRLALDEAEKAVNLLAAAAAAAATMQAEAASQVPSLRDAEAAAAAALQRLVLAREGLDADEERATQSLRQRQALLEQVAADLGRENVLAEDAEASMKRLSGERERIEADRIGEEDLRSEARAALKQADTTVVELEQALAAATREAAEGEARRRTLESQLGELGQRRQRLTTRATEIEAQRAEAHVDAQAIDEAEAADARVAEAQSNLDAARTASEQASEQRSSAAAGWEEARATLQTAEAAATRLEAEEGALAALLDRGAPDMWPPLIDAVTVSSGYEAALGAALGEDLEAPADEAAPVHWRTRDALGVAPALPAGAEPLANQVSAPPALARRLAAIGIVADVATGNRLATELAPGQRLVSRSGALWRWDGYTVTEGATTAAAARLEQRNRLADVREDLRSSEIEARGAREAAAAARTGLDVAENADREARAQAASAQTEHDRARDAAAGVRERRAALESRRQAVQQQAEAIAEELADTERRHAACLSEQAELPDVEAARGRADSCQAELAEKREHQAGCRRRHDDIERRAGERDQRLSDIATEVATWDQRKQAAESKRGELKSRRTALEEERRSLENLPSEIAAKRGSLMETIEQAETARKAAADRLAEAETKLASADGGLRKAETDLAGAREERVRIEGHLEQARQACHAIAERVTDRLDCRPDQLFEIAELKEDKPLPAHDDAERKVERLLRERETMGPVNLRAEHEMRELSEQMEMLVGERDDLVQAIEKLRRGINELNREGRQRLLKSFEEVNGHFQELFVRLFGGGRAHLTLTDSDDPLEAGLEIMASPPGKRLQVLSLLSGGEQALTATALLFAVFLTNPAPICVLDEVDAPLDDANVDRFCSMLEEMAHEQKTRFLIITHHRMTMARMERLYGVTMTERGVSQLVSVDLRRAEELRQTA